MKDNNKVKIDEALDHIKKAIIEKENSKSNHANKDDFILLDKIVSIKNEQVLNESSVDKKKYNKRKKLAENKVSAESKVIKNEKKKIKEKNLKFSKAVKEKNQLDDLVEKEIKPIIKKWIDKNLRIFVKKIVVEEMKSISKATQKPNNR